MSCECNLCDNVHFLRVHLRRIHCRFIYFLWHCLTENDQTIKISCGFLADLWNEGRGSGEEKRSTGKSTLGYIVRWKNIKNRKEIRIKGNVHIKLQILGTFVWSRRPDYFIEKRNKSLQVCHCLIFAYFSVLLIA